MCVSDENQGHYPAKGGQFFGYFYIKKTVKNLTALCIAILSSAISKFHPNKKAYHSIRLFNWVLSII